jgi:hypothetical protein
MESPPYPRNKFSTKAHIDDVNALKRALTGKQLDFQPKNTACSYQQIAYNEERSIGQNVGSNALSEKLSKHGHKH